MIELLRGFPSNVVAISCKGEITRQDYANVLEPALDKAMKSHEKIRLLYEVGGDFEGLDAGAAVEDFKLGMQHLTRFDRIAVVTDVPWIGHMTKLFGFLMPGAVRVFSTEDAAKARLWVTAA
jgi:hypothetical protein